MNTYNENLQSTVISSLQAQGLDQKTVQSKMNASMFTLYYAEGATISGREKLETSLANMGTAALVKALAVGNSNLSNNLLSSATQGNQYASQSISNTAIAAANVQVAANAVVKLASDIGSVFSIVSSADFGTEIYTQAKEARHLMDNTAYNAELTSQLAMDASIMASAVSASTVLDRAKSTNGQMNNLTKVLSKDFDTAAAVVSTDNAAAAATSAGEKIAEGDFEDLSADYKASTLAYNSLNRGLNLNLRVPLKDISATGFTVRFRAIKSPFERDKAIPYYPVQNYYLLLVKESKQFTFSIPQAEYVLMNQNRRLVTVPMVPPVSGEAPPSTTAEPIDPTKPATPSHVISVPVDINNFSDEKGSYILQDSDGDSITTGTPYVVYVMAVYVDEYKRKINVFDDFLSAPSQSFTLTNQLKAAQNIAVNTAEDNTITVTFDTTDNLNYKVQYRCMFLPASSELSLGLISQDSVASLDADIQSLEDIAELYDPQIEALQAQLLQMEMNQLAGTTNPSGGNMQELKATLQKLITDRQTAIDQVAAAQAVTSNIGFVFNLDIAEQVPVANYSLPSTNTQPSASPAAGDADGADENKPLDLVRQWQVKIGPDTTDNFGNPLMPAKHYSSVIPDKQFTAVLQRQYIPVVLTVSAEEEVNQPRFTNALSDFENTASFTAVQPNTNQ